MQRESPTEATVTTQPSRITKVTVVPEVFAAEKIKKVHECHPVDNINAEKNKENYSFLLDSVYVGTAYPLLGGNTNLFLENLCQS